METFGIHPSRNVGIIKNALREAILDGEVKNTFEEGYRFVLEKGKELGLEVVNKLSESIKEEQEVSKT
jgi:hypothetical protein